MTGCRGEAGGKPAEKGVLLPSGLRVASLGQVPAPPAGLAHFSLGGGWSCEDLP